MRSARILSLALLAVALLFSCGKDDDSSLRKEFSEQGERLDGLTGQVAELRATLEALQESDAVTAVEPIKDGADIIGFTIRFRKAASMVILLSSPSTEGLEAVTIEGDKAVFSLTGGETIRLPYDAAPAIKIAKDTIYVAPGGFRDVPYTLEGGDTLNRVEAVAEGDWKTVILPETPFSGKLRVLSSSEYPPGNILLMAIDGSGRSGYRMLGVEAMSTAESATNRYSMTLYHQADGSWMIDASQMAALDGAEPEGLYEPVDIPPMVGSSSVADVACTTVVYKSYPDRELHMNICPAANAVAPTPLVFLTHGGGWWAGDHNSLLKVAKYMAKYSGAAGVSVQYSLAGQTDTYIETSVQDLRDALTWLSAHAEEYNLDMSRIAFVGNSAGGHLSAVMAMTWPAAKVLVGWSGAYDIVEHLKTWGTDINKVQKYFHKRDVDALAPYSPVLLVPASSERRISCMLIHGTADNQVLFGQAPLFSAALNAAGQTVREEYYQYYSHGLVGSSDKNGECLSKTLDFIKDNL